MNRITFPLSTDKNFYRITSAITSLSFTIRWRCSMNRVNYGQELYFSQRMNSNTDVNKMIGATDMKYFQFFFVLAFLLFGVGIANSFAQAELTAWGNLNGIRIDGQLMKFTSSACLIGPSMTDITATGKEKQRPVYTRNGDKQIVTTELSQFSFTETVQDTEHWKWSVL